MRTLAPTLALLVALAVVAAGDDERARKVAEQKKAADKAWESLETVEHTSLETKHLLVYAPKTMQARLKAVGALLEKYHDRAREATGLDPKEGYPGKITVYLLPGREQLAAFARRVERRRPSAGEAGSFQADDRLHAAACPLPGKPPVPVEARAGAMLASLILQRRAGLRTEVPDWLVTGFGRATSYQVSPREKFVLEDRKQARVLVKKRAAADVWGGTLEAEEVDSLQGSLAEFLAYGPGRTRFGKVLDGFKPGENGQAKTMLQALEEAGLTADKVARSWKGWVR
jgi:hypothetical protein